jgi:hypothetical protein
MGKLIFKKKPTLGLQALVPQSVIGKWVMKNKGNGSFIHTPEWNNFINHIIKNYDDRNRKTITVTYEWDD